MVKVVNRAILEVEVNGNVQSYDCKGETHLGNCLAGIDQIRSYIVDRIIESAKSVQPAEPVQQPVEIPAEAPVEQPKE